MTIRIADGLPAKQILREEHIFALEEEVASTQQIRPLQIAILNLMPTKIETETQLLRLISKSPIQASCDFMRVSSHQSKNTSADHLIKFYDAFDAFKDKNYDALIVTGAPVEHLPFDAVDYWDEYCEIMDWSRKHVFSTMNLCWAALATMNHFYGIRKILLVPELQVLSESFATGPALIATRDFHEIYVMGHFEYARDTLANEYWRDFHAGLPIRVPENYFPDDNPENQPLYTWRAHANLLYRNWLMWVYQMTPYETDEIPAEIERLHSRISEHGFLNRF